MQPERKHRTIRRQDSIQKILVDHSKRVYRRHRSFSEEKPDVSLFKLKYGDLKPFCTVCWTTYFSYTLYIIYDQLARSTCAIHKFTHAMNLDIPYSIHKFRQFTCSLQQCSERSGFPPHKEVDRVG